MNPSIPIILLIVVRVIIHLFGWDKGWEYEEPKDVDPLPEWYPERRVSSWESQEEEEPWRIYSEPEEEEETPMQRFRRENTISECVKRGGFLTTGERMEAMYGACEEAAQCFPDEYYPKEWRKE